MPYGTLSWKHLLSIQSYQDDGGEVNLAAADIDQLAWKVLGRRETADLAGMDETQMAK